MQELIPLRSVPFGAAFMFVDRPAIYESGGNWYSLPIVGEGWIFPALFRYFDAAPERLYVKAEERLPIRSAAERGVDQHQLVTAHEVSKEPQPDHSPLPWKLELARVLPDAPIFGFLIRSGKKIHSVVSNSVYEHGNAILDEAYHASFDMDEYFTREEVQANGEFIERCANSHYDLIAALTEVLAWALPGTAESNGAKCETLIEAEEIAMAAIAKATVN